MANLFPLTSSGVRRSICGKYEKLMFQIMRTVGMASLLERESRCSSRLPFWVTDIAMIPGMDGCHLKTDQSMN